MPEKEELHEVQSQPLSVSPLLLCFSFFTLGLLVGTLLAFSQQSLTQAVVAALFAFFGGSIVPLTLLKDRNSLAAIAISTMGLSIGAMAGVYSGIYVNEHQLLSPNKLVQGVKNSLKEKDQASDRLPETSKYLKENVMKEAYAIDGKLRGNLLSKDTAYEQILAICTK
jgi:hypothetical protein